MNTIAVRFRRSTVEQAARFRQDGSPAEDYEILLHAARLCPSAHHKAVVAQYRRHPNSVSRKGAVMLRAMKRVISLQCDEIKGNPRLVKAWREGERYWRDHFGAPTIKQMCTNLAEGAPGSAAKSFGALLWYVRGRLFTFVRFCSFASGCAGFLSLLVAVSGLLPAQTRVPIVCVVLDTGPPLDPPRLSFDLPRDRILGSDHSSAFLVGHARAEVPCD